MPTEVESNETKLVLHSIRTNERLFRETRGMGAYEVERFLSLYEQAEAPEELYETFTREHYDWHNVDWETIADECADE